MPVDLHHQSLGDGPPMVILHGLFGSARNWQSIARVLSETHTVHTLDLRNHGASPWAEAMDYVSMADDVRQYIDSRQLGQPVVMGHSMGGKTAMALALAHPERVGTLIVVDIAPIRYGDTMKAFAEAMRTPEVLAAASRTEVQRRLERLLPDPAVAPFLMQNLVAGGDRFDWRINLGAIYRGMNDLSDFPVPLRSKRFDRPMTAIVGETSSYVPHHSPAAFQPMFPAACVEVVAGAGHWVHADRPQAFLDLTRGLLGAAQ